MSNPIPAEKDKSHEARAGFSPHSVRLAWILALAYLLVIVHASLQPYRGWRVPPDEILRFLDGAPLEHLANAGYRFARAR